jgi:hypothetical protein
MNVSLWSSILEPEVESAYQMIRALLAGGLQQPVPEPLTFVKDSPMMPMCRIVHFCCVGRDGSEAQKLSVRAATPTSRCQPFGLAGAPSSSGHCGEFQ